jgi:predicted Ser/Thr protein kinase
MDPIIGKIIDSYKVLEVLGRGGMGVVYKAVDTTLDRDVAIKMMDVLIASDPNFLKRFQSEAKALAKLQNPNIVSVFALRQTEFGVCIVMEFVKGTTLADVLRQSGMLTIPRAVHIFKQVLTALDHAHKLGVIHRDIKPGNIMLAEGDIVKVTDFGLAKIQKGAVSTMTMGTAGTLYYMSPEQIRGLGNVDRRGDIYSAGMAFYESLTGRVPFKHDDADFVVAQQIVEGRIPPPDKMNSSLPKDLVRIVMKSIDKDPDKRYQNAAEMVVALEHFGATMKPIDRQMSEAPTIVGSPGGRLRAAIRPKKVRSPRAYIIAGIAVAVLAITYFVVHALVFQDEGSLTVLTTPRGARIYLDNVLLERNPVESYPVSSGKHRVTAVWGDSRLDTLVTLEAKKLMTLLLTQRTAAEPLAKTTETQEISTPPQTLVDEKENHAESGGAVTPVREFGTLVLQAIPDGDVRIDEGKYQNASYGTRLSVPVGHRSVVFRGANGSIKETSLNLRAGETREIKCQFQGDVNIASTLEGRSWWGSITVDGKDVGITPKTITLPAGRHRIGVRREGLVTVGGEQIVTIEPILGEKPGGYRVSFRLRKP